MLTSIVRLTLLLLASAIFTVHADIITDADTVFDWAEQQYSPLMPPHQHTQQYQHYWYRAYPSTDFYAAINSQDQKVYYGTISGFNKGIPPALFDTLANVLSKATRLSVLSAKTGCHFEDLPEGHSVIEQNPTIMISSNGCRPRPKLDTDLINEYCPLRPVSNGISVVKRKTVTSSIATEFETSNYVQCIKHADPLLTNTMLVIDVCYGDTAPPVTERLQGKIIYERVTDCLQTDAEMVVDILNGDTWFKLAGEFIKMP